MSERAAFRLSDLRSFWSPVNTVVRASISLVAWVLTQALKMYGHDVPDWRYVVAVVAEEVSCRGVVGDYVDAT